VGASSGLGLLRNPQDVTRVFEGRVVIDLVIRVVRVMRVYEGLLGFIRVSRVMRVFEGRVVIDLNEGD
jgi:hypothetical protein